MQINNVVGGQEAEVDMNISLIHKIIDDELLSKNLISKYVPMISSIAKATLKCKSEELESNMLLYKSAIMSYCKLMLIIIFDISLSIFQFINLILISIKSSSVPFFSI